jgi:predicted TIM-barrel fold metal-dependent hydrolase
MDLFLKLLFFFCLIPLAIADEAVTFSAHDIRAGEGKYCSQKSFVDIHAHAACLDDGGKTCFVSKRMKEQRVALGLVNKYKSFFDAFGVSEDDLREKGGEHFFQHVSKKVEDSSCVQSIVLLALDGSYQFDASEIDYENTDFVVRNDFLSEQVRPYKNLLWAASINPFRKDFREELEKAYRNGAVLIKLIPPIQGIPLKSKDTLIIERLKEYFSLVAKYNLPILVHLDEEGTFSKELEEKFGKYVGLSGIELALEQGVTVIVAHVASRNSLEHSEEGEKSSRTYSTLLDLMKQDRYRNKLFADISALPTIVTRDDHLCRVVKDFKGQEDRLLWGSDYPLNYWKTTSTLLVGVSCDRSYFSMTSDEGYALSSKRNQWDRGIFLQRNMGVSDRIFNNTRKFLVDRGLVEVGLDGSLRSVKREF